MYRRRERPRRPAIPVALYALMAIVIAVRIMMRGGSAWLSGDEGRVLLAVSLMLLAAALVCLALGMECSAILCVVSVSLVSAFVLASVSLQSGQAFAVALSHSSISRWEFRVLNDPVKRNDAYKCRAVAMHEDGYSGDVWLMLDEDAPIGLTLRCVGRYTQNGDDEWGVSSRMQGVWGSVRAYRILDKAPPEGIIGLVSGLREAIVLSFEPESSQERALLAGCVSGSRDGLSSFGIDKTFSQCGSSHLIAVSGSHMAVLTALFSALCGMTRIKRTWRIGATIVLNGVFVVLCGAPVSAVRAWIMTSSALTAGLVGRRSHAISGVSIAGLVMVLLDPAASGQLGFLLSVSAVLGLSLYSAYATYVIRSLVGRHRPPRFVPRCTLGKLHSLSTYVCECLGASIVAQLSTLPASLEAFDEISLVGPVANVAISFPFTLMVGFGMVAALVCWVPALHVLTLMACDACASVVLRLASAFSTVPMCTITVGDAADKVSIAIIAVALAMLVFWPRVSRRKMGFVFAVILCVVCGLVCRWRFFAPPRVCVLDVGQGDAILVQDGSHALLVDAGPDGAIVEALARKHVTHLDAVLVTHLHADHYAGMEHLVSHVPCDRVYVAYGVKSSMDEAIRDTCRELTGCEAEEVGYGDILYVEDFALRVVWPRQEVCGDENADSIELALSYDDGERSLSGLLTGDAERQETGSVLASGDVGDIDFLKVGHHGSELSVTSEEARALDPEVAVASAGEGNTYGHPAKHCVDVLEEAGSVFLCTKDAGDVEIRPGADGPTVLCAQR